MNTTPSVAFVMVNWNQYQLTVDSLESLRELRYPNFQTILVDNGSHDGSAARIREHFREVDVVENKTNVGIAAANNQGIVRALDNGFDYIFLLNNDTAVEPDMLTHLIEVAESQPEIGITGPTMLYFDRPDTIWCAGNRIDWRNGNSTLLRNGESAATIEGYPCQDVDFITSCAACIKRAVFESTGLMDERYFIYYDETDWFARASAAGWRTVYVPNARMWHKVSATMGESSPTTDYYMVRNRFLFLSKSLRGWIRLAALAEASFATMRTITAYTVKNRTNSRLRNRNAKLLALRDATLGRWGPMGTDVAAVIRRSERA